MAQAALLILPLPKPRVMNAATAAAHPEIKTYTGTHTGGQELRLTISPAGIMGQMSDGINLLYFQPLQPQNPELLVVYRAADAYG